MRGRSDSQQRQQAGKPIKKKRKTRRVSNSSHPFLFSKHSQPGSNLRKRQQNSLLHNQDPKTSQHNPPPHRIPREPDLHPAQPHPLHHYARAHPHSQHDSQRTAVPSKPHQPLGSERSEEGHEDDGADSFLGRVARGSEEESFGLVLVFFFVVEVYLRVGVVERVRRRRWCCEERWKGAWGFERERRGD